MGYNRVTTCPQKKVDIPLHVRFFKYQNIINLLKQTYHVRLQIHMPCAWLTICKETTVQGMNPA